MQHLKTAYNRAASFFLFCLVFLLITIPAFAQGGFTIQIYPPELADFPKITLFLDAFDAQGKFIPSLDLNSFRVYEDGFERVVNETQLIEPGLHTIIAYNLGATMSNRQNVAVPTRYEETIFTLATWLNELQSDTTNQYSLTSNEGILVDRLQEKDAFTFQLQNYKPNLFNFQPDFASLSLSLDIAEQPNLIPQSKKSILYITPLPLDQTLDQLPILRARAIELRVPVNVWLVAPDTATNAPAAEQLSQLAASTGGSFLFYAENIQQPDPEIYVGRLRSLYQLRYTSDVSQSGTHTVRVEASYGNQTTETPELQFSINLNLPTAYLVDLPDEIERSYVNGSSGRLLQPGFVTLTTEYLFPDGYDRQLRATRLYVDGEVVTENREAPFEFFAWPLEDYQFSGEHLISVEVEDILGFRSISPPVSLMITVESLYPAWLSALLEFLISGGWIPVAITALGGTVLFGLQMRRRQIRALKNGVEDMPGEDYIDPLLQSVPGLQNGGDETLSDSETYSGRSLPLDEIPPRLVWESSNPAPIDGTTISLSQEQIIIGSDPQQSGFTIQEESVSPQHAVLVRSEGGAVRIADLGSDMGTWVNFAPVSSKGTILNNGDLVKIGKLTFRYKIGEYR